MKKVYITFENDGYNGEQIEKVFATEALAQDWVIKQYLKNRPTKELHELQEIALEYIESHVVIKE